MKPHLKRFVKSVAVSLLLLNLVACAQPPKFVSNYFNGNDPCQSYGKREGYTKPNWCGASGPTYSVTTGGQTRIYTINRY